MARPNMEAYVDLYRRIKRPHVSVYVCMYVCMLVCVHADIHINSYQAEEIKHHINLLISARDTTATTITTTYKEHFSLNPLLTYLEA